MDVTKLQIENIKELVNGYISGEIIEQSSRALTAAGDNYLSLVLKVDLKIKRGDDVDNVEAVAKFVPRGEIEKGTTAFSAMIFNKEIVWYRDIVPVLVEFEKECGVTGYTSIYPKYYGGRMNLKNDPNMVDENAVVMLEFLKEYKLGNRHEGFDLESTKLILKSLVKFHALLLALKIRKPEEFKEKVLKKLKITVPMPPRDPHKYDIQRKEFIDAVKEAHDFDHLVGKIETMMKPDPFDGNTPKEPWSTISHNDFWLTNFMINPANNDVKVLDFQATSHRSVATDVLFFLLTSTTTPLFQTHFKYLLRYYYDALIDALKELKVDTTPFSYESYLDEMKRNLETGQLIHSFMFTCVMRRQKGHGTNVVMEGPNPDSAKQWFSVNAPGAKQKIWDIVKMCDELKWI